MNKEPEKQQRFPAQIGAKVARKLKAQRQTTQGIWFGLGMMGLIGWSIVLPTLLGAALGIWLDKHFITSHSWVLTLLFIGLIIGCWNAWYWVTKENKAINDTRNNKDA